MPTQTSEFTSIGELGDVLGVQCWRIARLFELGILSEPPRLSNRRLIPKSLIPAIVDALRDRGWLPKANEEQTSSPDGNGQPQTPANGTPAAAVRQDPSPTESHHHKQPATA